MQKGNEVLGSVNRGTPCESGLCTQCRTDCQGQCETFLASFKGRRMLYTQQPGGTVTYASAGGHEAGVGYEALRIGGRIYGARGWQRAMPPDSDHCLSEQVDVSTQFGVKTVTHCNVPLSMGAALNVVSRYWTSYASAAALIGYPLAIGENAMKMDPHLVVEHGEVKRAPRIDGMIDAFLRYDRGQGAIVVQVNYDDLYDGKTVDYICQKYGDRVMLEIKWGQGGKSINGEVITDDLAHARNLRRRYPVFPDPLLPEVQRAYREGTLNRFTRMSKIPYTDCETVQQVEEEFLCCVRQIRQMGCTRIALKTGGFDPVGTALAIRLASKGELDLLTLDGAGGGTAHSPWPMMEHWGMPSLHLHATAYQLSQALAETGTRVVDLSFGGGFAREDHLYKALALGAPYCKLVTLCRAMIIPGMVGSNIQGVLEPDCGIESAWKRLPRCIAEQGNTPETIFESYYDVLRAVGREEMRKLPYGTLAIWSYVDKLMTGLRQLMCGNRVFSVPAITRADIGAVNAQTAQITGLPLISQVGWEQALDIVRHA